jgi:hypothetical protein
MYICVYIYTWRESIILIVDLSEGTTGRQEEEKRMIE